MSTRSGTRISDEYVRQTDRWLEGIMAETGWQDPEHAYRALGAVLQTLRDRLAPEDAVHVGTRLPVVVSGLYFEGWSLTGKPFSYKHKADFLAAVEKKLPGMKVGDLERGVIAVLYTLSTQVGSGEKLTQIRGVLPPEIRELWVLDAM